MYTLIVAFQYSIGDARAGLALRHRDAEVCAFNTPLEMPLMSFLSPMVTPSILLSILHWRCAFIRDVRARLAAYNSFNTPLEMPCIDACIQVCAQYNITFQYSIGDAAVCGGATGYSTDSSLSILHWRCRRCLFCDFGSVGGAGLSILHWRCAQATDLSERRKRRIFQYSIGDAR